MDFDYSQRFGLARSYASQDRIERDFERAPVGMR
jgi:hypothetical protein